MKTIVKGLIRDEKGASLVMVLILLLISGLIIGPLLSYMGTGLITGNVYEKRTDELYAADAGVEDAIWKIQNNDGYIPCNPGSDPRIYTITDVNGKNIEVTIEYFNSVTGSITYNITSIAATADGGNTAAIDTATTIEAYLSVSYLDLSSLLDNAIVSDTHIIIKEGVHVTGNVTSGGTIDNKSEDVHGTITSNADLDWPTADDLLAYYWDDVKNETTYDSDTIDLNGVNDEKGPLYRNGELTIKNSSSNNATLTLTGTLYITGDTQICYGISQNKDMTLDLNGQTIFVASDSTGSGHEALKIGDKCTIIGPGCIIAVGDIYFAPKGDVGSETDFVLVMSIEGTTTSQPSGNFYGCIAGYARVEVKQGTNATVINTGLAEEQDLNFPGMGDGDGELPPVTGVSIEYWEVIRLSPDDFGE